MTFTVFVIVVRTIGSGFEHPGRSIATITTFSCAAGSDH